MGLTELLNRWGGLRLELPGMGTDDASDRCGTHALGNGNFEHETVTTLVYVALAMILFWTALIGLV